MITKKCTVCNSKYAIREDHADESKYCSRICRKNKGNVSLICVICKKEFIRKQWEITQQNKRCNSPNPYCSKVCYENRSPKQNVKCDGCGKEFMAYPSRIGYYRDLYCTKKCAVKFGNIGQLTQKPLGKSRYQKFVGSLRHTVKYIDWRNRCMERDNRQCCRCPRKQRLTVHHRISMYEFFKRHGFDRDAIEKDKDFFDILNGETLCRRCHAKEHRDENKRSRIN